MVSQISVSVSMPAELIARIDKRAQSRGYPNRSACVRQAIERYLAEHDDDDATPASA
jgi:metal-responsive CopG/Arc/MetJ family transcriptional regulator